MTPVALVATAVLLGLFALAGGSYGGLYGAGQIWRRPRLVKAGFACYGIQVALSIVIIATTPLALGWKVFILLSCLAYALIPPITWRYLERMHRSEEKIS